MEQISNNHLKEVSKLKQKKFRNLTGNVVVEGLRTILHLNINKVDIKELYLSQSYLNLADEITATKSLLLQPFQFERITLAKNLQQIAALVEKKKIPIKEKDFILYLDNIKEPGNLGTIIRTADAAGASGIVLSPESCDIFNPKVIRASMGSVFTFPIEYKDYDWLEEQNSILIATDMKDAVNIYEFPKPKGNIILIIGSEANGINKKIMSFVDHKIKIPLRDNTESLNAAIASGIAVYYFLHNSTKND